MTKATSSITEPTVTEMEAELGHLQTRLFPLYAAQEAANVDATNYAAAQRSATGAALTDAIVQRERCEAEVARITKEIQPLKERAVALRREIDACKRAGQVAKVQQHARAAQELAPQVAESLNAFLDRLAAFIGSLNATGSKDVRAEIRALARHVEVQLQNAGLPDYRREGVQFQSDGTAPTDLAATAVALAESLR
jgi:molecular chaperone GrpE (heat shock protein)